MGVDALQDAQAPAEDTEDRLTSAALEGRTASSAFSWLKIPCIMTVMIGPTTQSVYLKSGRLSCNFLRALFLVM
ncbi:hypothetical protein EYF80_051422 [Liparis tanakae]|uniref:Uncharacterized protein n=1 Tax=Liparis tanakae TaxID=230148 RepID=A0A4Z2FDF8_9TELE|nr:hypothetical protein EYF80_051422 [Liparis tanakae]